MAAKPRLVQQKPPLPQGFWCLQPCPPPSPNRGPLVIILLQSSGIKPADSSVTCLLIMRTTSSFLKGYWLQPERRLQLRVIEERVLIGSTKPGAAAKYAA